MIKIKGQTIKDLILQYRNGDTAGRSDAIAAIMEMVDVNKMVRSKSRNFTYNHHVPPLVKDGDSLLSEAQYAIMIALDSNKLDINRNDDEIEHFIRNAILNSWRNLFKSETAGIRYRQGQHSINEGSFVLDIADRRAQPREPKDIAAIIRARMEQFIKSDNERVALEQIIQEAEGDSPVGRNDGTPFTSAEKLNRFRVRNKIRQYCADLMDDAKGIC